MSMLRKSIICDFLTLPLPAGEGWGGGFKMQDYARSQYINSNLFIISSDRQSFFRIRFSIMEQQTVLENRTQCFAS